MRVRRTRLSLGPLLALVLAFFNVTVYVAALPTPRDNDSTSTDPESQPRILILGGGVAGVIAAQTLHSQGFDNFLIIEAQEKLGGRMRARRFGDKDSKGEVVVEEGANWVQGTQVGDGPANPIYELAVKHGLQTTFSDFYGSMTTYDKTGQVHFLDEFNESIDDYGELTVGGGGRADQELVDTSARTGYSIAGIKPQTEHERAAEYFQFDWEYAQTPEQTSWIASSLANNYTFDTTQGGFSPDNLFNIDQRGFSRIIEAEAAEFLRPEQLRLRALVRSVEYDDDGVSVVLDGGEEVRGDYVLCTFSLGVLQNDDVVFNPPLPAWKVEAIQSMTMGTYTKIFLQFPEKFWFDTQFALYADPERGRYPVWQSLDMPDFLPGSGIVFVTVTGDFSIRVESLPDATVQEEVLGVLQAMYPSASIPEPLDFYFPKWHSDPLFRGSYANWPPSFVSQHHENLRANVGDRLWFAGEATSRRYFGFLHGAYDEGNNIAMALVSCIRSPDACNDLVHIDKVTVRAPYLRDPQENVR